MGSIRRDQQPIAILFTVGFVALVAMAVTSGGYLSWAFVVLFAGLAWWSWPGRTGKHTPHAEVQASATAGDVIVYWRPG